MVLTILDKDGVSKDFTRERFEAWVKKTGLRVPIAFDTEGKTSAKYLQNGPMAFLIDVDGTVVWQNTPHEKGREEHIERELKKVTPEEREKIRKEMEADKKE